MKIQYSDDTEDPVIRGLIERRREQLRKEHEERAIKDLEPIREGFWLDMESEAYLKDAARILFKDYKNLEIRKKRRVMEELSDMITQRGPPDQPVKILLRDIANKVRFE
ncbi:MAG: hypothetical protein JXB14_06920 [Candidatus Altiarchaeota archaeon]|nr:hypothetical protein [Candidatus Altiarchaeota archaeon]